MLSVLVCAFLAAPYRARYPLPNAVVPTGWGVNIHFTKPAPGEMEAIAKPFRWVRMDFVWDAIERSKGVYDFSAYDGLMASLDSHRLRPIFILDYGNGLYQKGSPRSEEAQNAFCDFVAASVAHFRHRGIVWEMWNEPNIQFWSPHPNVDEYISLARKVGITIRSKARDEWYIGPATSTFDWKFLARCFDAGLLRYWDAVSIHPYRPPEPESVTADWDRLRAMIARTAPKGRRVGMISGEWGYSDAWGGMSQARQGDYVVRQYLVNLLSGVDLSIWYDWKNDGPSPTDPEHHFGTSFADLTPKPAYS